LTLFQLKTDFFSKLELCYSKNELAAIWKYCSGTILQINRSSEIININQMVETFKTNKILEVIERLKNQEPIQYILEETWFCDSVFKVNPQVLIPRPETEELVYKLCEEIGEASIHILDIGTGSGCIAISIKKLKPSAKVVAIDISNDALKIAETNSESILGKSKIEFYCKNVLDKDFGSSFNNKFDAIVSNPPYIIASEITTMKDNVLNHEPHLALFCGDDALLFYRAIAQHAKLLLNPGGALYFEINEKYGSEVAQMLKENNFEKVTISKDFYQKDRIIKAIMNLIVKTN